MNRIKRIRALVVDDNELNRVVALRLLENLGVEVESVSSGEKALEICECKQHDLILMDIRMPSMCGKETTQALRDIEAQRNGVQAVIIGLTATSRHTIDTAEYLAAGMDGCVAKPIRVDFLEETIAGISKAQNKSNSVVTNATKTIPNMNDAEDLVDFGQASLFLSSADGVGLYRKFISQMTEKISLLENGIIENHDDSVSELIHELMGAAALFGFSAIKSSLTEISDLVASRKFAEAEFFSQRLVVTFQESCQLVRTKYELIY